MKPKTETRYVVERRTNGFEGHAVCAILRALPAARAERDDLRRLYPEAAFRIVKVTTTREVVR